MTNSDLNISVITLYVSRPNSPTETKILSHQQTTAPPIKGQLHDIHGTHIKYKHREKLKVKGEKIYDAYYNENQHIYAKNYKTILRERKPKET